MHDPLASFRHASPGLRVYYGGDALAQLPAELARAGCHRAVIVCGRSLAQLPDGVARLRDLLGNACAGVFDRVRAHSPIPVVVDAASALKECGADAVIALGGGSAIVTARAASILHAEQGTVADLCTRFVPGAAPVSPRLLKPKLPQFVLPTTPTTAYAKAGSAVVDPDAHRRLTMFDPKTRATALFFDPALMLSASPALAMDAALVAFAAAMQGLESLSGEPLSDALLLHAVRLLRTWLPRLAAEPASVAVRGHLMLAALLSGQGTDYAPTGLASVIGHCIGARFGQAVGTVDAVLLPHAIRFNEAATTARLATVFAEAGLPADRLAGHVAEDCAAFFAALGLPSRLRAIGIPEDALPLVAEDAQSDWFIRQNPRRVHDAAELLPLLSAAW